VACALAACHGKHRAAIAKLTDAQGPVDRQAGAGSWRSAPIGTPFYLGDAARTADGGAHLALIGNARIAMQPHTILRFTDQAGAAKITVELGAIELSGTGGSYGLEVGKVKLAQDASVRITAHGEGANTVELLVGAAQLTPSDGPAIALEVGKVVDLRIGKVEVHPVIDAGVDAPPPPPDAAAPASDAVQIAVTGRHAETRAPGEKQWKALPQGAGTIPRGTTLRLGAGTTAKLVSGTTTLELGGGSRTKIGDDLLLGLELGSATASVPAAAAGKVGVPGGAVDLAGTPQDPAVAKIDVNGRGEAKVDVLRGTAKLDGPPGTALALKRGETASLARAGTIHVIEAIPSSYDFAVAVGDTPSFTIHDPRGATALRFEFAGKCRGGGVIELDRDPRFRTAKVSGGKDAANMMVTRGTWHYRLRCTVAGAEGAAVASGRLVLLRDSGRRRLTPKPAKNVIDADGRSYTISYQSLIPNLEVHYRGTGARFLLHLATGGAEQTFSSRKPVIEIPGRKLREAKYTFWFDHDGVKQTKVTTLEINFDQTAPQVYIESPAPGRPFGSDIEVRGAVLPGWTAKVEGVEIPVDPRTRRFAAKVPPPPGNALAIRLSHAQRGVHYYLRRPK
jgi:hypothetical protein